MRSDKSHGGLVKMNENYKLYHSFLAICYSEILKKVGMLYEEIEKIIIRAF